MFNPEEFMQSTFEDEFETSRSLIPNDEYQAVIQEIEAKTVGAESRPVLSVRFALVNSGDEALDGRVLYHTVWLDMDERGALLRGPDKNIGLGQLLSAVGMNGKSWSPPQLTGQVVLVQVGTRQNKNTGEMLNNITRIAAAM
jgi:hypothetical protein